MRARRDDGVTLVEVLVALTIASGVFLALGLATIAGVKGTLMARQNQLAADMANQALERIRALDFADVTMVGTDPTLGADPRIVGGKFDPGTGTSETLVTAGVGSLNPHITVETQNNLTYTVARYVTVPATETTGTRRVTVVVTWQSSDGLKERRVSSYITATRRGLPLPRFLLQWSSPSSFSQGANTQVVYGMRLKNYGARDAWTLTGPATGSWAYYVDTDRDGVWDGTETIQVTDTDADGKVDTGFVETGSEIWIVAVSTISGSSGTTTPVSFTFTSIAQPSASSASQALNGSWSISGTPSPTPTPTPTPSGTSSTPTPSPSGDPQTPWPAPIPACGAVACSLPVEYFHELPLGAHSINLSKPSFDTSSVMQLSVFDYSIGQAGTQGRYLGRGGSLLTESSATKVFDARKQMNAVKAYKAGTAVVYLQVACLSGSGPLTFNASIGDATNANLGTFTSRGTGSATLTTCDGTFREVAIGVPIATAFSVAKNKYVVVRMTIPGTEASDVRVGYDWTGSTSRVVIPQ